MANFLSGEKVFESHLPYNQDTKKVWFKGGEGEVGDNMLVDLELREANRGAGSGSGDEIELMERDAKKINKQWNPDYRTPGLSRFMFKRSILKAVGGLVGKVAKLDFNTDSKTGGGFARMIVFVDLDRPLVSQVLVNGELQWVEYEALPTICFSYEKYGHTKEMCSSPTMTTNSEKGGGLENSSLGSRFMVLNDFENLDECGLSMDMGVSGKKSSGFKKDVGGLVDSNGGMGRNLFANDYRYVGSVKEGKKSVGRISKVVSGLQ
ncbi:hypothetical protein Gogos_019972, partial [Gossypium gossypioides]|nr:hypothetical protein [Gossypium gossypioides]